MSDEQRFSPDVELTMAAGYWLGRHPSEPVARERLAQAVQALEGADMLPAARVLWEAARLRALGQGGDNTLRAALNAFCADHAARNPAHRPWLDQQPAKPTSAPKSTRNTVVSFAARSAAAMDRRGQR